MSISRRVVLAGSVSGAIALGLPGRWAYAAARRGRYREAIVIDGLGGPGSLSAKADVPLADVHVKDTRDSGLTCVHVTIDPVGTTRSEEHTSELQSPI